MRSHGRGGVPREEVNKWAEQGFPSRVLACLRRRKWRTPIWNDKENVLYWVVFLFSLEMCMVVGSAGPQGKTSCKAWSFPRQDGPKGEVWREAPGTMNHQGPGPTAMVTQRKNKLCTHIYASWWLNSCQETWEMKGLLSLRWSYRSKFGVEVGSWLSQWGLPAGSGWPSRKTSESCCEPFKRAFKAGQSWGRGEKGNLRQFTESGLQSTVFRGKQQLSTGCLGAGEAQGSFLPSEAGSSSCSEKTDDLTELVVFPSLPRGVCGRVPAKRCR